VYILALEDRSSNELQFDSEVAAERMSCWELQLAVGIEILGQSKMKSDQVSVEEGVVVVGQARCYAVSVEAGHSRSRKNC